MKIILSVYKGIIEEDNIKTYDFFIAFVDFILKEIYI